VALSSIEETGYLQEWEDPVMAPVPFCTQRLDNSLFLCATVDCWTLEEVEGCSVLFDKRVESEPRQQ